MARPIMIQGTMSNAGKSVLTGGLLRVLVQDGYKAAPFKSQNMALNSFITEEGLEMGRAQVMQAEAAGIAPIAAMNPILLKPTNDTGSQVILNGRVEGVMSAAQYYRKKKEYIPYIMEAYEKLSRTFDVIVAEGAGSPAEINLKDGDIVNMGLAQMIDAPVLLVGDIDRGGVFAQIVGTIQLLEAEERARIKGTIINKFRGDKEILKPGLTMLEERTKIAVRGVIPYFHLDIDEEDSLTSRFEKKEKKGLLCIAVVRPPRISNFTDFAPLECMEEVSLQYVSDPDEIREPDAILLPGSKNTMEDMLWLRQSGMEAKILQHAKRGGVVFGICGGYQMLGKTIADPNGVERQGEVKGIGLLPVHTVFTKEKKRTRVQGRVLKPGGELKGMEGVWVEGYEIHMGTTILEEGGSALLSIQEQTEERSVRAELLDGAQAGNVYGCYIHGFFDSKEASHSFIAALLKKKGYSADCVKAVDRKEYKERQYDLLADILRENLDMQAIYEMIEKGNKMPCQ
ncbi:cobyric acid synthase [Mediterraneibacter sp. ICN-202921]|uniref:cobyric acid synthase n=1 Tax=Mediterraneibacter sp. ICN-202921 TaxID=3134657 RepID=UPI0030C1EAB5